MADEMSLLREFVARAQKAQEEVNRVANEFGTSPTEEVFDQEAPGQENIPMFFVTFGTKYATQVHPTWPQAHPDGVLGLRAPSMIAARLYAFHLLGPAWCMILPAEEWASIAPEVFSRGVLAVLNVPAHVIYMHPQGKSIVVWEDGSMDCRDAGGRRARTSATPEKLAAGHGAWKRVEP